MSCIDPLSKHLLPTKMLALTSERRCPVTSNEICFDVVFKGSLRIFRWSALRALQQIRKALKQCEPPGGTASKEDETRRLNRREFT
jgi:hypothetical protein